MMLCDRLPRLLLMALLALASGCAGERDAMEKEIADLHAEVSRLRASQAALGERLGTLELQRPAPAKGDAAAGVTAPPPRAVDRDRPELDVVRVSPSEGDGDADNDSGRPVVRAVGNERATITTKAPSPHTPRKPAAITPGKKAGDADIRPVVNP
jgi:hypothetical protein